jgi:hypothetical protein
MSGDNFYLSRNLLFFLAVVLVLAGCQSNNGLKRYKKAEITIKRFDQDLFDISVYDIADSITSLEKEYPQFLPLFGYKIVEIGGPEMPGFEEGLQAFVSDFTIYRVNKRVKEVFYDITSLENELSEGFGRHISYFPGYTIPKVITCVSGFNQSIITTEDMLVISLDKYLGADDEFYKLVHPPIPEYQRTVMHPGKISSDALYGWIVSEFAYNNEKDNLLSLMVYKGRAMYCVKQLVPDISDTLLWGFSTSQIQFCIDNEKSMWEYLVENKLLFETEKFRVNQFVNPAPFTKDFSQESPGMAAVWLGYQIVESLDNHNRELTLQEIMEENNYQKLLQLSKYNP